MNLQHLKYIVEVEHTGSITRAAENLFMGQPNLSKAIKDMETELGFKIFKRSSKGVTPTDKGLEFLQYAKSILVQINKIESIYTERRRGSISFSLLFSESAYISYAAAEFLKDLNTENGLNVSLKEDNTDEVINSITIGEYNLGIIRVENNYDQFYMSLLSEKNLKSEVLWEYELSVLLSDKNRLREKETVTNAQLSGLTEVVCSDTGAVHNSPLSFGFSGRRSLRQISARDRESRFEILTNVPDTYMWASRIPEEILKKTGIKEVSCSDLKRRVKDVLIYRKDYALTRYDNKFISVLNDVISKLKFSETKE